jgi:hypothetical protein
MGLPTRWVCTAVAAAVWVGVAGDAAASETTFRGEGPPRRGPDYMAFDAQGIVHTQLLPKPFFGADLAYVLGNTNFNLRLGALLIGSPAFEFGVGKIANALQAAQMDMCAAQVVLRHRIRMCMGAQGGVMQHRWIGYERPGRKLTPWFGGTLKGDYTLSLTKRLGLLFGVGVVVAIVGPEFHAKDASGHPVPLVFPGPVAGDVSLGLTVRLR